MTVKRALTFVILLFLLTLLVELPARWALAFAPSTLQCIDAGGTLWSGHCGQLRVDPVTVEDVSWQLHPAALLHATVSLSLRSDAADAPAHADIELRAGGSLVVRDLSATLSPTLAALLFPKGWSGALSVNIARAALLNRRCVDLVGTATLQQLASANPPLALGGFELQFPPHADGQAPNSDAPLRGRLTDLGGPLVVNGDLALAGDGAYELTGTVATRAGADADVGVAQVLDVLGPADAQGRHVFSIAGTL